jgi:hypothetical protein
MPTSTATTKHNPAGKSNAARNPHLAASGGSASAATITPSGCAVCRAPIARPRRSAVNHPMTIRPLAAFTDAPAAPANAKTAPRQTTLCPS